MVDDFEGYKVLMEKEKRERDERMKKRLVTVKETLQYVGIIGLALASGVILGIKKVVAEAKKR